MTTVTTNNINTYQFSPVLADFYTTTGRLPAINQSMDWIDPDTGENLLTTLYGISTTEMTTAQLIAVLTEEMGKTRQELALTQIALLKVRANKLAGKYQDNINKLLDAAAAQIKAAKEKEDMEIVKWTLFGIGILISIITLGAASGVVAAVGACVSIAMALLDVIPVDSKGNSTMDKLTEGFKTLYMMILVDEIKKGLGAKARQDGYDFEEMTDQEIIDYAQKNLDEGTYAIAHQRDVSLNDATGYGAMTTTLYFQLAIAFCFILVGCATKDAGSISSGVSKTISGTSGAAVTGTKVAAEVAAEVTKKAIEETVKATQKTTSEVIKATMQNILKTILETLRKAADKTESVRRLADKGVKAATIVKDVAQIGVAGANIKVAIDVENIAKEEAEIATLSAQIKFLLKLLQQDQELIKELLATQAGSTRVVQTIIRNEHRVNAKLAKPEIFG